MGEARRVDLTEGGEPGVAPANPIEPKVKRSRMSALGHKRTFCDAIAMSALPPKADMCSALADVRLVPKADIAVIQSPRRQDRRTED
jgi:hypothetical protein